MKYILSERQKSLAEANLSVVRFAIRNHIGVNEQKFGFEYDDLYQEGCLWLCKAASTFDDSRGILFKTYAEKVVTNGLRTYCRLMKGRQNTIRVVEERAGQEGDESMVEQLPGEDPFEELISQMDIEAVLGEMKKKSSGTVRLGIEAIEWKVKGLTGTEIAKMYGVRPNLVGAWISRASARLKEAGAFAEYLPRAG